GASLDASQLSNVNNPAAIFTPAVNVEGTYKLRWTVSNLPCTDKYDEVDITVVLAPATPETPTSNSPQCGNTGGVTLSRGTPPDGQTWYWQTSATGTDLSNSDPTYTVTAPGTTTVYLRARMNAAPNCWSDAADI